MREIKFRAWDEDTKEMFDVFQMQYTGLMDFVVRLSVRVSDNQGWHKPLYNFILMQYTGLKDKNGKEIYEGDIVKSTSIGEEIISWVNFWDGYFTVEGRGIAALAYKTYEWEVIGNIYENPELLAESKKE